MKSYICLNGLCFFSYHGVTPQERVCGNEYILSLKLETDITRAMQTDNVADTLNYAEVYQAVRKEMEIPSQLLEHVGGRIIRRLFLDFPSVTHIELKLSKRNPPMGADIASAGIEIQCGKEDFIEQKQ